MLRIEGSAQLNEQLLGLVSAEVFSRVLKKVTLQTVDDDPNWLVVVLENPEDKGVVFDALFDLGYNVEEVPPPAD